MSSDGADSDLVIRTNNPQSYGYDGIFGYPEAPDLTDELLQKTRTSFAMRLMTGKNQTSSFSGGGSGTMGGGGLSLGGPMLGGS